MARRVGSRSDLAEVTVLALLRTGPRHPYELHRMVLDTHKNYVTGLPRSVYYAVDRLAGDGLVTPVETTREGRRPERTVYQITAEGRAELAARLRSMLELPHPDATVFVAAVSLIGCVPTRVAVAALRARAAALRGAIAGAGAHLDGMREILPRVLLLEAEFQRSLHESELNWVTRLVADIGSGEVGWPDDPTDLVAELPERAADDAKEPG